MKLAFIYFADLTIEADGKLSDETGALVTVEDLVDGFGVVGGGFDDFAFAELELHAVKGDALVDGGSVVADDTFHAVLDR